MSEQESFEEYVYVSDDHTKEFKQIIDKYGVFGYVKTMMADFQDKYRTQPKEGYIFILWNCKYLYKICKDLPEYSAIQALMKGLYNLDTKCRNTPEINHALDDEEFMNRLHLIDQNLDNFKDIFVKEYFNISQPILRTVFIEFSHLIFKFNGYQVSLHVHFKKTMKDDINLTDLFNEFLKEVQIPMESS